MSLFDRLSVLKNKSEIKLIESKQVVEDKVFEIRHGKLDDIPMTKERKRSEKRGKTWKTWIKGKRKRKKKATKRRRNRKKENSKRRARKAWCLD